jgi:phosphoadenosine phosphosulfate reductase
MLTAADTLHTGTASFRQHVRQAASAIESAAEKGRIGVSFSGGKDSLVTLHLVRSVFKHAPAALFDSGVELPETLELARHYDAEIISARLSYLEIARYAGEWGYPHPVDAGCPFDLKAILIDEPSETFVVRNRLSVCAIGLRGQESRGRKMNAVTRGTLYQGQDRTWYLCPLQFWTVEDVWGYIAQHELRYHSIYDAMDRLNIPRCDQRLGMSMGTIGLSHGRMSVFKRVAPEHFARLAAEFPKLREAT